MAQVRTPVRSRLVPRAQSVLAVLLLVSLLLIGQRLSVAVYGFGVILILVVVTLTFTFNNISRDTRARGVVLPLLATWTVVAGIFFLAYLLAPALARIGG